MFWFLVFEPTDIKRFCTKIKEISKKNSANVAPLLHFETRPTSFFDGGQILDGGVDFDVPHVGVPPVLVVRNNRNLDHEGPHGFFVGILQGDHHPSRRLDQFHDVEFSQVVDVISNSYGQPGINSNF